ncbi:hypothetical protein [Actinomadura sp. GTD37]|uniref:hypothetical protein n=1 Tax=Actinomadura sp. GTD37 TaxID=1778030 RepID=UPI0035C1FB7C
MAAKDPTARSRSARIAANVGWAMTPNRTARASHGHRKSPVSLDYWRDWAKAQHPDMSAADQLKAAKNRHKAHMQQMALKSAASRRKRSEEAAAKAAREGDQPAA